MLIYQNNLDLDNPNLAKSPIGVFDSGVGGISVLHHIHELLPAENLLYYADSHFAPYGSKTPEFIRERALFLADFLIAQGAKALVVACNTATAAAVMALRERHELPIIGMEPAVKPAAAASQSGVIGVLATSGTLQSAQFAGLLESYGQNVKVVTQACHGLVECVERGELTNDKTRDLLISYLKPLLAAGVDTIVLGCTHYPFLRPLIEKLLLTLSARHIAIVDTGAAVARQLKRRLLQAQLLAPNNQLAGSVKFWANSQSIRAAEIIEILWGGDAEVTTFYVN